MSNRTFAILALLGVGPFLVGCVGFEGAEMTLDPQGPVSLKPARYALPTAGSQKAGEPLKVAEGDVGLFEASYAVARTEQLKISSGLASTPTSPADVVSMHARQMAFDGINLTDRFCNDFFRTGGDNQKWLTVSKDLTAVGGSVATGVLAIASPANSTAAAVVALTTGTAYQGVDLYTKDFLFGSDNIESVRQMTMNALEAHKNAVFQANANAVWSYGVATSVIDYHQSLCTPASIRNLVLASIAGSRVTPGPISSPSHDATESAASAAIPSAVQAASAVAPNYAAAATAGALAAAPKAANAAGVEMANQHADQAAAEKAVTDAATNAANSAALDAIKSSPLAPDAATQSKMAAAIANVLGPSIAKTAIASAQSSPLVTGGAPVAQNVPVQVAK